MLVELRGQCGLGTVYASEIFVVHIIDDAIRPVLQTAKLNLSAPMTCEERIVDFLAFADNMSLRTIESYVVKTSEILASR
jgi:hypothetical protein